MQLINDLGNSLPARSWKRVFSLFCLLVVSLSACGPADNYPPDVASLPDPHHYSLNIDDLPPVGVPWVQTYDQYSENGTYKWLYVAFEASEESGLGSDLGLHLAVNNDIVVYIEDVSLSELPQPPQALGEIQNIAWQTASLLNPVGEKSAAWQTYLGDLQVPVWWLEFYQGYVYGRISLFGFPLDVAPSLGNALAQATLARLPLTVDEMRQDATQFPTTLVPKQTPMDTNSQNQGIETPPSDLITPAEPLPTPTRPVPTPTMGPPDAAAVLDYLTNLPRQGDRRVISGQNLGHGDDVVQGYASFVTALKDSTDSGRTVGMIGVDYGWIVLHPDQTQAANQVMIDHWNRGGLVTASIHLGNPFRPGSGVHDSRGVDLIELITPGTNVNSAWMAQLDTLASALSDLQDAGVVVLWRPFHEMNGGWHWWLPANYKGNGWTPAEDFIALWRHMYNYFTNERGLHNLLWVYSPAAQYNLDIMPTDAYYPGDEYVDIVGYTYYSDDFSPQAMDVNGSYSRLVALGKPFAITEVGPRTRNGSFDTAQVIQGIRQGAPLTTYFVFWHSWISDGVYRHVAIVDNQNASALMDDPWTLALGDLSIFP